MELLPLRRTGARSAPQHTRNTPAPHLDRPRTGFLFISSGAVKVRCRCGQGAVRVQCGCDAAKERVRRRDGNSTVNYRKLCMHALFVVTLFSTKIYTFTLKLTKKIVIIYHFLLKVYLK